MIRPRGTDFYYSNLEFELMKEDIKVCKKLGADGVVFGILLPDGKVDIERTKQLVELARPMSVTFHRAFDVTVDPFQALEDIIDLGFERILTAGQKNTVPEGIQLIKKLVEKAADRIIIMPGSGINAENIQEIRDFTGAKEFHLTGRKNFPSKMSYRKQGIFFGGLPQIPEYEMKYTDPEIIRKVVTLVNQL
jgi:copper homeostasis protein